MATEAMGYFSVLEPSADGVRVIKLGNTLSKKGHGLEGANAIG